MKTFLIDSALLFEAERRQFDLGAWFSDHPQDKFLVCDAGIVEFLAGQPVKDQGKLRRFREFWQSTVAGWPARPLTRDVCETAGRLLARARQRGFTVPLGDGLHAAVADREGMTVATPDTSHFEALGVTCENPLAP